RLERPLQQKSREYASVRPRGGEGVMSSTAVFVVGAVGFFTVLGLTAYGAEVFEARQVRTRVTDSAFFIRIGGSLIAALCISSLMIAALATSEYSVRDPFVRIAALLLLLIVAVLPFTLLTELILDRSGRLNWTILPFALLVPVYISVVSYFASVFFY